MYQAEQYDLEPKRKLKSADTAQLLFSAICLINSGYLIYHHRDGRECGHYEIFMYFLFFGSLIWLIYLLLTVVIQFRNKGMKMLLSSMDWVYIVFHLAMFVWANVLFWNYENSCSSMWDFWVLIYLLFGYIAFFCIVCVLFMGLLRKINKKRYMNDHPHHHDIQHAQDYGDYGDLADNEILPDY